MHLALHLDPPRAAIAIAGELDAFNNREIAETFDRLLREGRCSQVFVDLSEVTFADSSSVVLFERASREMERAGLSLVVVRVSRFVERVAKMVGAVHLVGLGEGPDGGRSGASPAPA
jgi:anti-anti-sigma factor